MVAPDSALTNAAKSIAPRDLKPANVMLASDGSVKVLDFGLAKAWQDEPEADGALSMSPTLTAQMTWAGVILGTAAYMSPEQAEGLPVDSRADIFAFGCVLYEMLIGERAFPGSSVADTLSRILRDEPQSVAELLPAFPRRLGWLLEKCLAKSPAARYQDTRDLIVDLRSILAAPDQEREESAEVARIVAPRSGPRRTAALIATGVFVAITA